MEEDQSLGIQQGSIALCRYRLLGGEKRLSLGRLSDLIEPYKAKPLTLTGLHKEEVVGWVRPVGLESATLDLPPDAPWDLTDCQVDDGFVLRLRIERRKVPAALLQLLYKQEFYAETLRTGKTPGPTERRELRDHLQAELMGRALPTLSHVDVYWRDVAGELMLFHTGKKVRGLFEALFNNSFSQHLGLTLVAVEPPLIGLTREQWEDSQVASETLGRLSLATPAAFADQNQNRP